MRGMGDSPSKCSRGGLAPSWGGGGASRQEGSCHFAIASRLQEKEPKLQKATMSMMPMPYESMKVHDSCVLSPAP